MSQRRRRPGQESHSRPPRPGSQPTIGEPPQTGLLQHRPRGSGRLVFVSSIAGAVGVRHEAVYAATKAALNCLAESLDYELAGSGVGVSVVLPGVVDTPFFSRRGRAYHRNWPAPIPAERVAAAITDAAARDVPVMYVPRWLRIPAWLHGAAPRTFAAIAGRVS